MKVSICIAYFNRRALLLHTLNSISKSKYFASCEVIIVDDNSDENERVENITSLFPLLDIRIFRFSKEEKTWINPCMPFNKAFSMATGDAIIIQSPECYHNGDIVKHVIENISNNNYIVFGCYALNQQLTDALHLNMKVDINNIPYNGFYPSWFQHSTHRQAKMHWCSAMLRSDLISLGGFDERYAYGMAWDDAEFRIRIENKQMNIIQVDDPFVFHQYHGEVISYMSWDIAKKNEELCYKYTRKENNVKVNNRFIDQSKITMPATLSEIYDSLFSNDDYNPIDSRIKYDYLNDFLKTYNTRTLVDIGTGRGHIINILKESYPDIKITTSDLGKYHTYDNEFYQVDIEKPESFSAFNNTKYDILTCFDVLEHIHSDKINDALYQFSLLAPMSMLVIANHSDVVNNIELHITQRNSDFWTSLILNHFAIMDYYKPNMSNNLYIYTLISINFKR